MGRKSKSPRGNTRQHTEPSQQEINQLVDAFNHAQYTEMEQLAQAITVRFPNFGLGWNGLGTALLKQQRYTDALLPLQRAVILQPQDPQAHNNIANTYKNLHRYLDAENSYRSALKIAPNFAEIHYNLGRVIYEQKRYTEAEPCYRQSLTLSPSTNAYNALANVLLQQSRFAEAESNYRETLKIDPQCSEALLELGQLQMEMGQIEHAEKLFHKVLSFYPDNLMARYHLAQLRKVKPEDENLAALIAAELQIKKNNQTLPLNTAVAMHFALGKSYDDIGAYEQAIPHFISGGKLRRTTLEYDSTADIKHTDKIIHTFSAKTLSRLSEGSNTSSVPIFVVGMPRSGTTLTEQIISSHPDTHGAGELNSLMAIIENNTSYPDNILNLHQIQLTSWADDYLKALQKYSKMVMPIVMIWQNSAVITRTM